jgi:8-oxo-dGTP pyrophosphatase MutT (NUDIX family)
MSKLSLLRQSLSNRTPYRINNTLKRSSVALILRPSKFDTFDLLYLRRADHPGDPWSGQVSFPGGKREEIDRSDLDTAIRETQEETGLDLANTDYFQLFGRLDDRPAYSRGKQIDLSISAFVFLQIKTTPLKLEKGGEVSAARWVPSNLLIESNVNWDQVKWEYVSNLFPIIGALPKNILVFFGLSFLRFPSISLHTFSNTDLISISVDNKSPGNSDDDDDDTSTSTSSDLPFNLWGLTFRLTEDLLKNTELVEVEDQKESLLGSIERPQVLFEDKKLGILANFFLKKYSIKY